MLLSLLITLFLGLISIDRVVDGSSGSSVGLSGTNINNDWNTRNLEAYFSRLGSRLDQLVLRFDHLDSRMNRFTSLLQGRLDGVENSLSTTKLKMDLWGEELGRIDEQLTRKWKNMEAKLELLVPTIDSKLENKATLIQRDNRRHNEHLSSLILGIGQRFDAKAETIIAAVGMSLNQSRSNSGTGCEATKLQPPSPPPDDPANRANDEKLLQIVQVFTNKSEELLKSNSAISLIGTKVTNMFEDLIERSNSLQTEVKGSITISNQTRQEVREGLRLISQNRLRQTLSSSGTSGSTMTSSETMSAVIVEALASVESMSNALGRRMAELSRSIEGRFEMVSNTLNGFLDSCLRIQEGAPLIEEHIASVLEKILDGIDNTTRGSHDEMYGISKKLDDLVKRDKCSAGAIDKGSELEIPTTPGSLPAELEIISTSASVLAGAAVDEDPNKFRAAEILENSQDLTEDEKKLLWDSLFPNHQVPED